MELNERHIYILDELDKKLKMFMRDSKHGAGVDKVWFTGNETEIAHLLERGFIHVKSTRPREKVYEITASGIMELANIRNPPNERAELLNQRAALVKQLAAVDARLGVLDVPVLDSPERMIAARFHEGD